MGAICAFSLTSGAGLTNQTDATQYYGVLCTYQISFDDGGTHFDQVGLDIPKHVTESERKQAIAEQLTEHLNEEFPGVGFTIQDMKDL